MRLVAALTLIWLIWIPAVGQNSSPCPTISIIAPKAPLTPFREASVSVSVVPSIANLKFDWRLQNGLIVSGQGTSEPSILAPSDTAGTNLNLTVRISGLPDQCQNKITELVGVWHQTPVCGLPLDDFGDLPLNDVKARIDNFFVGINNNPGSEGVVLVSFSKDETNRKRLSRINKILDAIRFRRFELTRVTFVVDAEPSESRSSLWIVPVGADLPGTKGKFTLVRGEELAKNPRLALSNQGK